MAEPSAEMIRRMRDLYLKESLQAFRRDALISVFQSILALAEEIGDSAWMGFARGSLYWCRQELDAALTTFEASTSTSPGFAYAWNGKGNVLRDLERYGEALTAHERAIALDPDYASPWVNKAIVLGRLNRLDEALLAAEQAIALAPRSPILWNNKASILGKLNRFGEALKAIEKAITLAPHEPMLRTHMASILRELRPCHKARRIVLDKSITSAPNVPTGSPSIASKTKRLSEKALRDLRDLAEEMSPFFEAPSPPVLWEVPTAGMVGFPDYRTAGRGFAAAMWLVDHAPALFHALSSAREAAPPGRQADEIDLLREMLQLFKQELGLPPDRRMTLVSRLLIGIGVSIGKRSPAWRQESIKKVKKYAGRASLSTTGTGDEAIVLPWALSIEMSEDPGTLKERVRALRDLLAQHKMSDWLAEGLNDWAYALLALNKWKAATPMAIIAMDLEEELEPAVLDTVGWAYFFEGDIRQSLRLLSQALKDQSWDRESEAWAEYAYHKLCVLVCSRRLPQAKKLLRLMQESASEAYWTERARHLEPLVNPRTRGTGTSGRGLARGFVYDVALSFSGKDRSFAEGLACELRKRGVKVFYDEFETADLWGKDLYAHLVDVYSKKARYCIMLVSSNYLSSRWTILERQAAHLRAFGQDEEYILPVLLDRVELPGLLPIVGHIQGAELGPRGVADCFLRKLARKHGAP